MYHFKLQLGSTQLYSTRRYLLDATEEQIVVEAASMVLISSPSAFHSSSSSPPLNFNFNFNPSLSLSRSLKPPSSSSSSFEFGIGLKPIPIPIPIPKLKVSKRKLKRCRALFSDDAPFAAAIGACMLTSLLFPILPQESDDDGDSAVNSTDARLAVMGIVSFIPYFNWLSWVFAWLDTGKRRYAVYAIVYLAPYLRSNLSLSPEESWLPIASILFCIVHIQLEASIRNGDIQGFQLFRNVSDQLSSSNRKKGPLNQHEEISNEGSKKENKILPHAQDHLRDIGGWEDSQKPLQSRQPLSEELDDDDGEERSNH